MNPRLRALLPLVLDIVIPTAGYYLLHAAGLGDFWALTLAGAVTAAWTLISTLRRGRLDGVGLLVVLELVLTAVLFAVVRDPRIVLLKPSFYTALAGAYLLWTSATGRPLTVETSRAFVAGDPARERAADRAWAESPSFRREHVLQTAVWGTAWIVESVVRGVIVLRTDIGTGVWASQIPGLLALVVCMGVSGVRSDRLRGPVDARVPAGV